MRNLKGITLIALIITIVVLLILAAVAISSITGDGIIFKATEANFKTMMSGYKEQADLYMLDKRLGKYFNNETDVANINAGATGRTPKMDIKDILGTDVKKGYENKIAVEIGELYYVPTDLKDNQVQNEIRWCFELGIKVKGFDTYEEFEFETSTVPNGRYEAVGGVYVNTPDLTGFSKANTYYVTYDSNGANETIGDVIAKEPPSNWYDYQNKIWANVVTKNNGLEAYWVWIPRYAYKITYYTDSALTTPSGNNAVTSYGNIDVKFLSKDNVYKEYPSGNETQYTEASLAAEGYKLSDAFSWDGNPISGYWVSKYEVSTGTFSIEKTAAGGIKVSNIDGSNSGTYKYYLDGELKYSGTGLYTFENLEPFRTYEIKIENANGGLIGTRKVFTNVITNSVPKTLPDVSGYKDTYAYYVTYDENGANETIGDRITFDTNGNPTNVPEGWYNYQNKIWANIVTASAELTDAEKADISQATDKKVAYWVWIPRYEYKTIDTSTESDYMVGDTILKEFVSINFIDTSTTVPTREEFKIPDAFSWNGNPISGYWVSKYEVSE